MLCTMRKVLIVSKFFSMCLNHLLSVAYSGCISIMSMEQNPPYEEATEVAWSRADFFGLKAVKTRQLYLS